MKRQSQAQGEKPEHLTLVAARHGKYLYQTDQSDLLLQVFNSNGTDNGKKRSKPDDADVLRTQISAYLFEHLDGFHIPTCFVGKVGPVEMTVKWTEPVRLMVRVFNYNHPALMERIGYPPATHLEFPVLEHYLLNGEQPPALVNEFHIFALSVVTPDDLKQINRIASKVNALLRGLCDRRQLALAEVQLEFGRAGGQVILTGELSPLNCRFLDLAIADPAERDRFGLSQENPVPALSELCDRLMLKV
jgi:phosphoribosylaminoimidazole-succinocarboxamide synthase